MYATYIARRTQIYLDDEQDRHLAERALQVGRTKSALIRDAIDSYLAPSSSQDSALAGFHAAVQEAMGSVPYLPDGALYVEELRSAEAERQRVIDQRH
jgi:predicted transcriptional regulator